MTRKPETKGGKPAKAKSRSGKQQKDAATPADLPAPVDALGPDRTPCDEADQATLHAAEEVFKHLLARVKEFEANLPERYELGIQLANFGGERALHVRGMGFRNPNIIEFYGLLDGDRQVAVVQHVSQLNFLLVAVPPVSEQAPYRIGFGADLDDAGSGVTERAELTIGKTLGPAEAKGPTSRRRSQS